MVVVISMKCERGRTSADRRGRLRLSFRHAVESPASVHRSMSICRRRPPSLLVFGLLRLFPVNIRPGGRRKPRPLTARELIFALALRRARPHALLPWPRAVSHVSTASQTSSFYSSEAENPVITRQKKKKKASQKCVEIVPMDMGPAYFGKHLGAYSDMLTSHTCRADTRRN